MFQGIIKKKEKKRVEPFKLLFQENKMRENEQKYSDVENKKLSQLIFSSFMTKEISSSFEKYN